MLDGDELLTIAQLAMIAQVSRRTLEQHIHDGRLKVVRLGYRTVRIHPEEARRWLEGQDDSAAGGGAE
jgi:excisionase family DNA binding protein